MILDRIEKLPLYEHVIPFAERLQKRLQQIIPSMHRVKSGKKNMWSSRMKNAGLKCIFIRLI